MPLSGYSGALGKTDSPFLFAVFRLETAVGTANGSLVFARARGAWARQARCSSLAAAARRYALGATIAFALVTSFGATIARLGERPPGASRSTCRPNPSWVDATGLRDVTLLQTAGAPPAGAVEQLYWNRSITREALVGAAMPTDVYAAPRIHVARDGTLLGVGGNVLVQDYAATARFANARLVATAGTFSLWSADRPPRLALLERGRFSDGWLARAGRLSVWPDAGGTHARHAALHALAPAVGERRRPCTSARRTTTCTRASRRR